MSNTDKEKWIEQYTYVANQVTSDARLTLADYRIYVALCSHNMIKKKTGVRPYEVFPSQQTLRNETGTSHCSIERAVRNLETFGYIKVIWNGRNEVNHYKILPLPSLSNNPPQEVKRDARERRKDAAITRKTRRLKRKEKNRMGAMGDELKDKMDTAKRGAPIDPVDMGDTSKRGTAPLKMRCPPPQKEEQNKSNQQEKLTRGRAHRPDRPEGEAPSTPTGSDTKIVSDDSLRLPDDSYQETPQNAGEVKEDIPNSFQGQEQDRESTAKIAVYTPPDLAGENGTIQDAFKVETQKEVTPSLRSVGAVKPAPKEPKVRGKTNEEIEETRKNIQKKNAPNSEEKQSEEPADTMEEPEVEHTAEEIEEIHRQMKIVAEYEWELNRNPATGDPMRDSYRAELEGKKNQAIDRFDTMKPSEDDFRELIQMMERSEHNEPK